MPRRLRPTAAVAADVILVGDPGRALLLAQELLEAPRMSNHARGLWGYSGKTPGGHGLTIQATGIGGPSAAAVLSDLAKLGVRRAVRIGTCAGLSGDLRLGQLLLVAEAVAGGGSGASFGVEESESVTPDPALLGSLRQRLGADAPPVAVASFDTMPAAPATPPAAVAATDMQTVALLAQGRRLGIATSALLIVAEVEGGKGRLEDGPLAVTAKRAGEAVTAVLSG